jgi:hypothetical protein
MLSTFERQNVLHGTWQRVWRPVPVGTVILGYEALEAFLDLVGESYQRFEIFLQQNGLTYLDFDSGRITQQALTAWFTANRVVAGETVISDYVALETFLIGQGETIVRFEQYLEALGEGYDYFEAGNVTEESLTAWFAAN